jgi:antitoxin component YwqK of YwqJK toxin-antitoxin module
MIAKFTLLLGVILLMACSSANPETSNDQLKLTREVVERFDNGEVRSEKYYEEGTLRLVRQVLYYRNGQIQQEGEFKDGRRNGEWISYFENGNKWSLNSYKVGILDGEYRTWYENGEPNVMGHYTNGQPSGTWKYYDENGNLLKEDTKPA